MRTKESLVTLIAELEGDFVELGRVAGLNRRAWERIIKGANDVLDYAALAFTLHNLYGILENYFLRISKYFENNLPAEIWHKTLVDRMALDIPGIRPALIESQETKFLIKSLCNFRLRVHDLDDEVLDSFFIDRVQGQVIRLFKAQFPEVHNVFLAKINMLSDTLE